MLRRWSMGLLAAMALPLVSGCCCGPCGGEPWGGCWPHGPNWCDSQCGEKICHEWCSFPPPCCEPCDDCGCYIGPKLNDSIYSRGNDYRQARRPEVVQGERVPTEATGRDAEPYVPGPAPGEELPGGASGASYYEEMPPSDDPPPQYRARGPRPPMHGGRSYGGMVDSRHASRTLARPPRTRLFSR